MRLSWTLSAYFGRQFTFWVLGTFCAIMAIVFLLDLIELLRRGAAKENAHFAVLLQMALLKMPHMGQQILPFAMLFGSMMAFTRLTRTNELVVARAAGVSVWQFLMPAIAVALLIGAFKVAVFNPIASVMIARFNVLEDTILRNRVDSFLSVGQGGLWIRERTETGQNVLHARATRQDDAELANVLVMSFGRNDRFEERIDAARARLHDGYWELLDAVVTSAVGRPELRDRVRIPTRLTIENIQDSFASPETMSFWELPGFIRILENAGFSAVKHRLYWHALLASPLLLTAMVLIAATFSLRLTRRGSTLAWAASGLFFGFVLYFVTDIVFALGLSASIPAVLAAWTPATVTMLLGMTSLLHLEDG
ncbi:MAG: LPS export ABC transporter permease LptG [Alphaproteobacteria bacterium]|nr:LPS export ABC transporter permease LptG [Alphaproteobacteria bacterium]